MIPEARLDIVLATSRGRVERADIRSTRMTGAAGLLAGRRPDEVLRLLPTVFSLCGTAQRIAAEQAVEDALGLSPSPEIIRARRAALLAETIAEHGMALARDWPALLGAGPDLAALRALRTATRDLNAARAAFIGLLRAAPDLVLGCEDHFRAWAAVGETAIARLAGEALGLGSFAAAPFRPMPAAGPADLKQRMAEDEDGSYVAHPDGGYETGVLARRHGEPLVSALMRTGGASLAARLAARLIDLSRALQELPSLMQDLGTPTLPTVPDGARGAGLGMVEAARGLLVHRVELEDGRVKRYQILAPTEWNFHPQGPLALGLAGAPAGSLEFRARLAVLTLDPCVPCTVTVEQAHA